MNVVNAYNTYKDICGCIEFPSSYKDFKSLCYCLSSITDITTKLKDISHMADIFNLCCGISVSDFYVDETNEIEVEFCNLLFSDEYKYNRIRFLQNLSVDWFIEKVGSDKPFIKHFLEEKEGYSSNCLLDRWTHFRDDNNGMDNLTRWRETRLK